MQFTEKRKIKLFYPGLFLQPLLSFSDFPLSIKQYPECYNRQRIRMKLKGLSPVDYRNQP
ncbi:IS3 family transposase [Exercitatus varius]|uniref:IS3 family transposase n=1 Tax=Exercitatus varius TaxID=67857 RepID=UPI00374E72E6